MNFRLFVQRALITLAVLGLAAGSFAPAQASTLSRRYVAAGGTPFTGNSPLAPCDPGGLDPSIGGACFVVPSGVNVSVDIHDDLLSWVVAYYDIDGGLTSTPGFLCGGGVIPVPADGFQHAVGIWVGGADVVQGTPCVLGHLSTGQATTGTVTINF